MPTSGAAEAFQAWTAFSTRMVTRWSAQAKAVAEASDPAAQTIAVRDGLALGVTSAVDLTATALSAVTLLVTPSDRVVSDWYDTAADQGERTLVLAADLVDVDDSTRKALASQVWFEPATLAPGLRRFTISMSTRGIAGDHEFAGTVHVLDAAGAVLEAIPVSLLV